MAGFRKETSRSADFAKGGKTKMFGHDAVTPSELQSGEQAPGGTAHKNSGGAGDKYACGGKTKMFGFSGSLPARAGISSAR